VRTDGYHELDSIFYPLPYPRDDLTISLRRGGGVRIFCDMPDLDPENNTLTKAYKAFAEAVGMAPGIEVSLRKRIPVGAGLGGGSGNAAALLRWLNRESGSPLNFNALAELALTVGADTPFFLRNSPCRVRGIGERLTPVGAGLADYWLVLVCPDIQVSTREAYAGYDALLPAFTGFPPARNSLTEFSLRAKENTLFGAQRDSCFCGNLKDDFTNDLEAAVFPRYPLLASVKSELSRLGADVASMSGSGASLFGLFPHCKADIAKKVALALRSERQRVFLLHL
jgi:4-diphosphocytidyl-2-C-methyl-D-erythritol kinase